ncbi:unnamed protein product [Ectocarpus sp. 13 AM-2016]
MQQHELLERFGSPRLLTGVLKFDVKVLPVRLGAFQPPEQEGSVQGPIVSAVELTTAADNAGPCFRCVESIQSSGSRYGHPAGETTRARFLYLQPRNRHRQQKGD